MSRHRYVFRSVWAVPAPPDVVYATLARLDEYPHWWRQVRRTNPIDDDTCELVVRSTLPYDLRMTAHHARRDPAAGVLEARLTGDLEGHSRWTLAPVPGNGTDNGSRIGTRLEFGEEVEVHHRLLRLFSFARPAFRANHALMMRAGERGLRDYLDGAPPAPSP